MKQYYTCVHNYNYNNNYYHFSTSKNMCSKNKICYGVKCLSQNYISVSLS